MQRILKTINKIVSTQATTEQRLFSRQVLSEKASLHVGGWGWGVEPEFAQDSEGESFEAVNKVKCVCMSTL